MVCSKCAGNGSIVREEYVGSVRTVVREVCYYCDGREKKFAQGVMGLEESLKFAQCVLELVA